MSCRCMFVPNRVRHGAGIMLWKICSIISFSVHPSHRYCRPVHQYLNVANLYSSLYVHQVWSILIIWFMGNIINGEIRLCGVARLEIYFWPSHVRGIRTHRFTKQWRCMLTNKTKTFGQNADWSVFTWDHRTTEIKISCWWSFSYLLEFLPKIGLLWSWRLLSIINYRWLAWNLKYEIWNMNCLMDYDNEK